MNAACVPWGVPASASPYGRGCGATVRQGLITTGSSSFLQPHISSVSRVSSVQYTSDAFLSLCIDCCGNPEIPLSSLGGHP